MRKTVALAILFQLVVVLKGVDWRRVGVERLRTCWVLMRQEEAGYSVSPTSDTAVSLIDCKQYPEVQLGQHFTGRIILEVPLNYRQWSM